MIRKISSIKTFAKALGITQTHLNAICHTAADTSALKLVQEFTLNEAKKYLLNTSYTIAAVACFLSFNHSVYFGRLFKKQVRKG